MRDSDLTEATVYHIQDVLCDVLNLTTECYV